MVGSNCDKIPSDAICTHTFQVMLYYEVLTYTSKLCLHIFLHDKMIHIYQIDTND